MDVFQYFFEYRKCDIALHCVIDLLFTWRRRHLSGTSVHLAALLALQPFGIAWQAKLMLLEPAERHANITAFSHTVAIGTKCLGSVSKGLWCGERLYRWALLAAASSSGVAQSQMSRSVLSPLLHQPPEEETEVQSRPEDEEGLGWGFDLLCTSEIKE